MVSALRVLLFLAATGGISWSCLAQIHDNTTRIGVLAFRGSEKSIQRWAPTADYLSRSSPGYEFEILPLTLEQMTVAAREGNVDFILTNPGNYVALEADFGVTRIATLKSPKTTAEGNVFGAVIFVRAVRTDIQSLSDLQGKRFMAVGRQAFGGFQMAWRKLKSAGIDPFYDFAELRFGGFPQDRIAMAVMSGEVDAGTLRTGVLEDMISEGRISAGEVRVLDPQNHPGFRLKATTRLYPEWPFSKLRHTDPDLAQRVAVALLSMPTASVAAQAGGYAGWTVPLDYQPVHQLFKDLKIGPYADLGQVTPAQILHQYGVWLAVLLAAVLLVIAWTVWVEVLVNRRTRELSRANDELARQVEERRRAENTASERGAELARIGRLNLVGEMASGLAHELNHPLATIINYANGSIRRLKSGTSDQAQMLSVLQRVSNQAQQAADIINSMRELVRKGNSERKLACLNSVLQDASVLLEADTRRNNICLELNLADPSRPVHVDAVQVEQVVLNLARNAMDAMSDVDRMPTLSIAASEVDEFMQVAVRDNGSGVPQDVRDKAFDPFVTTKESGLGLGLSISKTIVEAHGGRLWTHHTDQNGTEFRFTIPVATA